MAATESTVQLPAATAPLGKNLAHITKTDGLSNTVEMQQTVLSDSGDGATPRAINSGGGLRIRDTAANVSSGGSTCTSVPTNAADVVVKASAGRLCRVLVTTTGVTPLQIYDNATAGSGTIIGALPASPALGIYDFQLPAANGITIKGSATNPAVTVSFL